ncbi:MAG: hypothetical protein JSW26_22375 [Desulfobacterales bacterium]|nr:MAG: hypothetical protein JSW26_22375 [Desulfobacterales bacterium]
MNALQPWPMPLIQRETFLSNEVEVLQTDVMRFFAILCLCLMAIFALVKTLPMAPPTGRPSIVEPTAPKAEVEALQKYTAKLKEKLAELRDQVEAAAVNADKSSTAAAIAEKKEQEILNRLNSARQEFERVSQSLEETRGALKFREMKLAEIMNDLDNKKRIRSDLQTKIVNESEQLAKIQAKLEHGTGKLNRHLPQKQQSEKLIPEGSPPLQPVRKGFTLRFASDESLQELIRREKVIFYALAGNKVWQLHLKDGQPVYLSAQFPRQIYEMQTSTVPIEYSGVFQQQVAAFGRTTVTWGVTLPFQMTASINRLIKDRDGGDLVIMADGEVVIN